MVFLGPKAWPPDPGRNQAEAPPPSHSREGMALKRAIVCACPALDTPQTARAPERGRRDWHGEVVRQQAPLYKRAGWLDLIGAFTAKPATIVPVLAAIRYKGQIPLVEQPFLDKPNPWSDPERGRP